MLQQTTVGAVLPRYEGFLRRFPDVASLARAPEETVLAAWSGLGYYARARNLRSAAQRIVREHGGEIPRDVETLRSLPGFGEYIAAAVASLAFGVRAPAADANVARVLSRLRALPERAGTARHWRAVRDAAVRLLPHRDPGRSTAALMDLGQTICLPRRPDCPRCPVRRHCAAFARGAPERYPRRNPKPAATRVAYAAAYVSWRGRALLERPHEGLLRGMWIFPAAAGGSRKDARRKLREGLRKVGVALAPGPPLGGATHTVVNRRLSIVVFRASLDPPGAPVRAAGGAYRWFNGSELAAAPLPTLTRKIGLAAGLLQGARGEIVPPSAAGHLIPQGSETSRRGSPGLSARGDRRRRALEARRPVGRPLPPNARRPPSAGGGQRVTIVFPRSPAVPPH